MKCANILILFSSVFFLNAVSGDNLVVGTTVGAQLVYSENVDLSGVWLTTRSKNVFYSSEKNQIIRGISAVDLKNSEAKATITAGGMGSSFVNLRLKSEKGEGLKYFVQIFV